MLSSDVDKILDQPWIYKYVWEAIHESGSSADATGREPRRVQVLNILGLPRTSTQEAWVTVSDRCHIIPAKLTPSALEHFEKSDNGCDRSELSTLGKALVTIDEFQIIFTAVPQMAGTRHALGFHMALQVDMLEWTGETASDVIGRPRHVEKCRDLLPTNFVVSGKMLHHQNHAAVKNVAAMSSEPADDNSILSDDAIPETDYDESSGDSQSRGIAGDTADSHMSLPTQASETSELSSKIPPSSSDPGDASDDESDVADDEEFESSEDVDRSSASDTSENSDETMDNEEVDASLCASISDEENTEHVTSAHTGQSSAGSSSDDSEDEASSSSRHTPTQYLGKRGRMERYSSSPQRLHVKELTLHSSPTKKARVRFPDGYGEAEASDAMHDSTSPQNEHAQNSAAADADLGIQSGVNDPHMLPPSRPGPLAHDRKLRGFSVNFDLMPGDHGVEWATWQDLAELLSELARQQIART